MASKTMAVRRPASHYLHQIKRKQVQGPQSQFVRTFTTTAPSYDEVVSGPVEPDSSERDFALTLDADKVSQRKHEKLLQKHQGVMPTGSRRRRAAIQTSDPNFLPFEQMPYQCFQEARKVLAADREEKLAQITVMRSRIGKVLEQSAEAMGGDYVKQGKLVRMQKHLEHLKILADINDPIIKKRFEDGMGMLHTISIIL